jgi:glyoxylate utilization-related uncharacterized protein
VSSPFPRFVDARGLLLPVEFGELPFVPARMFLVVGPAEGSTRGGHLTSCHELMVLVSGSVEVRYDGATTTLSNPGDWLELPPGGQVDYDLAPGGSTVAVLADQPYPAERDRGDR